MPHPLCVKHARDPWAQEDGHRILVDRLWPRGISKERLRADAWAKELAPTTALRKRYDHRAERYEIFRRDYRQELANNPEAQAFLEQVRQLLKTQPVTLVFGSKERVLNQARVLEEWLLEALGSA